MSSPLKPNPEPDPHPGGLFRNPSLKSLIKSLARCLPGSIRENLQQWWFRSVHEEDFRLFGRVSELPGLFLDLGANRGHAAISVLRHTRRLQVLSLEPNSALRPALMLLRLLHPWRFHYRMIGAGTETGTAELLIPQAQTDLSTQASLDPAEFEKDYVRKRLADEGHGADAGEFTRRRVQIQRIDELELEPDVVKIDVEGWEAQAIEGMQATLEAYKPLLIIEINNSQRWAPGLHSMGYRFFTLEGETLREHPDWSMVPGLNMICGHPESTSVISQTLLAEQRVRRAATQVAE